MTLESPSGADVALGAKPSDHWDASTLIAAVVAFANGDTSPKWVTRGFEVRPGKWARFGEGQAELIEEAAAESAALEMIEAEREYAKTMLDLAASGAGPLVNWLRKQSDRRRSNISLRPYVSFKSSGIHVSWRIEGPTTSVGWVLFAAALLASSPYEDETNIGKCRREGCGRFFLINRAVRGKPHTKYCGPTHGEEQHAADASERKRVSRGAKAAGLSTVEFRKAEAAGIAPAEWKARLQRRRR